MIGRLLDPIDWLTEAIYSILIVLTFTLAFRILVLGGDAGQATGADYADDIAVAALSAALGWGLIDGLMYVLMSVFERGERHRLLKQIHSATTDQQAVEAIADELDHILDPIAGEHARRLMYGSLLEHLRYSQAQPNGLRREDFAGALGSVLIAVVAVLPSLLPFALLRDDLTLAIRLSNVVSFAMLFFAGYGWGSYTGTNPWRTGLLLAAVALLMVLIAVPLGG